MTRIDRLPEHATTPVGRLEDTLSAIADGVSLLQRLVARLEQDLPAGVEAVPGAAAPDQEDVQSLRAEVAQLRTALESRVVIERAKGVIMAKAGCDEDAAFAILVAWARDERRKVREIAADVVGRLARSSSGPRRIDLTVVEPPDADGVAGELGTDQHVG